MMRRAACIFSIVPRRQAVVAALFAGLLLFPVTGCDSGESSDALPPPPPVRLSATQTSDGITLAWDTNAPERTDGYNVYRASGRTPTADGPPLTPRPGPRALLHPLKRVTSHSSVSRKTAGSAVSGVLTRFSRHVCSFERT
jgi:hypothetical protein